MGQTRQQARLALGTPLVADAFHANRWDYVYEFNRQGQTLEHRRFTVYFVDDKVARWEGDEVPPPPGTDGHIVSSSHAPSVAGSPPGSFLRARAWQLYLAAGGMAAVLYLTVPTLNGCAESVIAPSQTLCFNCVSSGSE